MNNKEIRAEVKAQAREFNRLGYSGLIILKVQNKKEKKTNNYMYVPELRTQSFFDDDCFDGTIMETRIKKHKSGIEYILVVVNINRKRQPRRENLAGGTKSLPLTKFNQKDLAMSGKCRTFAVE